MNELKKSAQSVQDALERKGLQCEVVEFPASTRTAIEAAASIGCEVGQIAKSLIFKAKESGRPVLVIASGPNRVNEKLIETHLGESLGKADADFTREMTGFAIGGIPPIGHLNPIEYVFIDQDLLNYPIVWAAAGTPNAVFSIKSADLVTLAGGKVIGVQ